MILHKVVNPCDDTKPGDRVGTSIGEALILSCSVTHCIVTESEIVLGNDDLLAICLSSSDVIKKGLPVTVWRGSHEST